jgi:hypothetical protein
MYLISFICLNILKDVESRKSTFSFKNRIHSSAPSSLPPGAAAPISRTRLRSWYILGDRIFFSLTASTLVLLRRLQLQFHILVYRIRANFKNAETCTSQRLTSTRVSLYIRTGS